MTRDEAKALLAKTLPCPHCGEKQVAYELRYGWCVMHRPEADACAGDAQLMCDYDVELWNRRAPSEREARLVAALKRTLSYLTSYPGGGADKAHEQALAALMED